MRVFILMFVVAALTGCAQQSGTLQQLQLENKTLAGDLKKAETEIRDLSSRNSELDRQVAELKDINRRLQGEKDVRVAESGSLRASVREFVKQQSAELRNFSSKQDLLDYVGSELIERQLFTGKDLSLVDTRNPIPGAGTVVSVKGLFTSPAKFKLVILRALQGEWLAIWETPVMEAAQPGLQVIDLEVPVSVEKGDIVGYVFNGPVSVPYDTGTGGTMVVDKRLSTGSKVKDTGFADYNSRMAFSIGVQAILN